VFGATVLSKLDERARATARQSSSEAARQRGAARPGRSRQKEHRTWAASPCLSISGYCRRAPRCEPWGCGRSMCDTSFRDEGASSSSLVVGPLTASASGASFRAAVCEPNAEWWRCGKVAHLLKISNGNPKVCRRHKSSVETRICVARSRTKPEGETRKGSSLLAQDGMNARRV
jgi:hypothetical protein